MTEIVVYDPPMCCSTGVCGPSVDDRLVTFAADLDWLKSQGVGVKRFNPAQQAQAFADNAAVVKLLGEEGEGVLPLILVDGRVAAKGGYPDRSVLAALAGVTIDVAARQPCCSGSRCC